MRWRLFFPIAAGLAIAADTPLTLEATFDRDVKPFLGKNCVQCHNDNTAMSGIRVDQLDAKLEERHLKLWEHIRKRVGEDTMPPKGMPRPAEADRERTVAWIDRALDTARSRPAPKNGLVRRLTVAQYRNTLRELLGLDDDFTEILPPDAISKEGFVNNTETLQLSPLLLEAYFEIAEDALNRATVDPAVKPRIQNFRMDLGAGINKDPLPGTLILGANSLLLENPDFTVTQLTAKKPFPFEPFFMRTKYRFIEGYAGNDTVRGWRDFDSIYHAVFACMRGNRGYPKGAPYSTAPEGLLLRPAIPSDELFGVDGTYGPRANFKISLRELPDYGPFRVTVTAAKYDDGLLLDPGAEAATGGVSVAAGAQSVTIPKAGIYQVDVHTAARGKKNVAPDSSRLSEGLGASWTLDGDAGQGRLEGNAHYVDSPFGKAVSLDGTGDFITIPRDASFDVGKGDFTVSAWIRPETKKRAAIVARGAHDWTHGWYLDIPNNKGILRFETAGKDQQSNGSISSAEGTLREGAWQHVAAVVRRGADGATRLYVNGYQVASGRIGKADLDNPNLDLRIGRLQGAPQFKGEIDEVRIYRRALDPAEVEALIEPGRALVQPPPQKPQDLSLTLGEREFIGKLEQPAFLAVRLPAGPLALSAKYNGFQELDRVTFTPLAPGSDVGKNFLAFEKRSPRLSVQLGLRRDCGSTFAPVGKVVDVPGTKLTKYVFEGAIRNYPSPDVEKDNVNYLAGVREIAVHSEYTDGRDMPRLVVRSVEFEGPFYETWPPKTHRAIFGDGAETPAAARAIVRLFATRAFRRPVTAAEMKPLMAVYDKSRADGRGFRDSIKDTLQVVLTSPQFLFLIETSAKPQAEPVTRHELASKLSYFLWNGPPDAATLRLAGAGMLRTRLDAEVDRMVADPRFSRFARQFAEQWLGLDKFQVLEPDRKKFPLLSRDTRSHLKDEPVKFIEYLMRNNRPVRDLIDSDFIVADEAVASYYGLGDQTSSGFEFVAIPHGRRDLGGVMTQAALMAGLSDGRESNPVKRGAWMARKIVAEPPDDPPPNVPPLDADDRGLTLRQRLEQHRNNPGCLQCHQKIDPWGVALEQYDAGGRFKEHAVDATSTLPDKTEVAGIADLKRYLSGDRIDQVAFSVLKHLSIYAAGRSLTYAEMIDLKRDAVKLRAGGYRMRDMIHFVAHGKPFLEK
ncbi:MAG: DUF1592 domain-containing protein [Bryobacteraceae bacterium]